MEIYLARGRIKKGEWKSYLSYFGGLENPNEVFSIYHQVIRMVKEKFLSKGWDSGNTAESELCKAYGGNSSLKDFLQQVQGICFLNALILHFRANSKIDLADKMKEIKERQKMQEHRATAIEKAMREHYPRILLALEEGMSRADYWREYLKGKMSLPSFRLWFQRLGKADVKKEWGMHREKEVWTEDEYRRCKAGQAEMIERYYMTRKRNTKKRLYVIEHIVLIDEMLTFRGSNYERIAKELFGGLIAGNTIRNIYNEYVVCKSRVTKEAMDGVKVVDLEGMISDTIIKISAEEREEIRKRNKALAEERKSRKQAKEKMNVKKHGVMPLCKEA